ncbi:MAG: RNA methyltransferase [Treponema sp.]|jgi:tRNA/rRNA methyltransferase/tRNA (cytidine32/uridine32-2'-O)-methyltransferase|nr:RNA methyltransferase [Treponema sp.]
MKLEDAVIILSRPSEPGNVGAVCRVMMNMGLSRLRIVCGKEGEEANPAFPGGKPEAGSREDLPVRARAVHAERIWEESTFYNSLEEAAADLSLLVGTTRRRGRGRKQVSMDPRELASFLRERPGGSVGIVFGNERFGLDDAELKLCSFASHIPADERFPSLNLSHAVQIYAWELLMAEPAESRAVKGHWEPISMDAAKKLTFSISSALEKLGFYRHPGREEQERFIRDLILRAGLSENEARYFKDIMVKAGRMGREE